MKLKEALDKGIVKVKLPGWNEWAYLEISGVPSSLSPWATLYDVGCNGRQLLLFEFAGLEIFEEWKPPKDYETRKDEIYEEFEP